MKALALLLIGFSLFSAVVLALTHFRRRHYADQPAARVMGLTLLAALAGIQVAHFAWLYFDRPWIETLPYRLLLFAVAPAFHFFSRPLMVGFSGAAKRSEWVAHALPIVGSLVLPPAVALPVAFLIGAGYLAWLGRCIYLLRGERAHFRLEIRWLSGVFAIALGASALGIVGVGMPDKDFFVWYAIAIGSAFVLVQITLGLRPALSTEVTQAAQAAYASSTLGNVDCAAALARLAALMADQGVYKDPDLSLASLARRIGISSHQLSELINTRLGVSYSRYLREKRVAAAKAMLLAEPSASVLSVGLGVGFTSQSNFYEAFRELEGMTPGRYRKLHTVARAAAG